MALEADYTRVTVDSKELLDYKDREIMAMAKLQDKTKINLKNHIINTKPELNFEKELKSLMAMVSEIQEVSIQNSIKLESLETKMDSIKDMGQSSIAKNSKNSDNKEDNYVSPVVKAREARKRNIVERIKKAIVKNPALKDDLVLLARASKSSLQTVYKYHLEKLF